MNCPSCNQPLAEGVRFCANCGAPVEEAPPVAVETVAAPVQPELVPQPAVAYAPQSAAYYAPQSTALPPEHSPLGAWTYFWLRVLFCVPIVGFIFLIVFSCSSANIHRRNFARSYWCGLIIVAAIAVIVLIICLAAGVSVAQLF